MGNTSKPAAAVPVTPEAPATAAATASPEFDRLSKFLRQYSKGERIFEQGDSGHTMFFIHEGRVRIVKLSQRRQQPLAVLEPGSFFGEMAVVNDEPRSARAEALSDCTLLEIDREVLNDFLSERPEVALRMIRTLAERLRNTDQLVERLLAGDPAIQVVEAILELASESDADPPYIRDIHTLMVKSATDPTLLRWMLQRLKQARFVSVDDRGIRVGQVERLRQYLNFLRLQQDFMQGR